MTAHELLSMSKEAFLAWTAQREEFYEHAHGRAILLPRITVDQARLTGNLRHALHLRLDRNLHDVLGRFAVHVGESVRFPDAIVERAQHDGDALKAEAPILLAEVPSPETLHVDFGEKRQEYLGLPTLDTYLVVSPDEPRTWVWQRTDDAFPAEPDIVEGLDKQIILPALGIDIPVSEIYRGIL